MIILNQAWLFLQNVLKTKPETFEVELFFSAKEDKYFAVDFVYKPKWGEVSLGVWSRRAEKIRFFLFLDAIRLRHSLYPVSELNKEAKKKFTNGIGSSGKGWMIPDLCYKECGDIHDVMYSQGCTKKDKIWADYVFLWNMKRITPYSPVPYFFFWAVRFFGSFAFYFADRKKTIQELNKLKD